MNKQFFYNTKHQLGELLQSNNRSRIHCTATLNSENTYDAPLGR